MRVAVCRAVVDELTQVRINGSVTLTSYDSDVEGMRREEAEMIATFVHSGVLRALGMIA